MKGELRNFHGIVFQTVSGKPRLLKSGDWFWLNGSPSFCESVWKAKHLANIGAKYDILKPVAIEPEMKK